MSLHSHVETYRKAVRYLKQRFPVEHPVSVRRLKISQKLDGDCGFNGGRFIIRIHRDLPEHEAIDVLIHEFAHVLSWHRCPTNDHSSEWGRQYSRVYRAFMDEFLNSDA